MIYSHSRILKNFDFFNLQLHSFSVFNERSLVDKLCVLPSFFNFFYTDPSLLGSSLSFFKNYLSSNYGHFCVLHVKGIGFKVFYYGKSHSLYFLLGFNHLVKFKLSKFVSVRVRKQYILLFSDSNVVLGQTIYGIRHLRFPDPYRGKGIRYRFQVIKFKPGKQR